MNGVDAASEADDRHRLLEALNDYALAQTELGRLFARSHGLHATDAAAIVQIIGAEDRGTPLTPARLAERIGLSSGATSILLNRLEAAGHITRSRDQPDRRIVTLRSSTAIHRAADAYYGPVGAELADSLREVDPGGLAQLTRTVESLRRRLIRLTDRLQ